MTNSMVSSLSVDEISSAIRAITGQYEDTFQDVWAVVVDRHLDDVESIQHTAREISRKVASKVIQDKFKTVDLDAPIGSNKDESDSFTLKDIIPTKEPSMESQFDVGTSIRRLRKPMEKGVARLDPEVCVTVRQKFPSMTLNQAVRSLLGLPLNLKLGDMWQSWEDETIRKLFPELGAVGVQQELEYRTVTSIYNRAKLLAVRRTREAPPGYLSADETAKYLGVTLGRLNHMCDRGVVKFRRQLGAKNARRWFNLDDMEAEKSSILSKITVPIGYVSIVSAMSLLHTTRDIISFRLSLGNVHKIKLGRMVLVNLQELRQAITNPLPVRAKVKLPYKVAFGFISPADIYRIPYTKDSISHFVYETSNGDWVKVCSPNTNPVVLRFMVDNYQTKPRFVAGLPHCKRCLRKLGIEQQ